MFFHRQITVVAVLFSVGVLANMPAPPPDPEDACVGKRVGDSCDSMNGREWSQKGTCLRKDGSLQCSHEDKATLPPDEKPTPLNLENPVKSDIPAKHLDNVDTAGAPPAVKTNADDAKPEVHEAQGCTSANVSISFISAFLIFFALFLRRNLVQKK